jgi:hypothetical protein
MFGQRTLTAAFALAIPLAAHGQLTYEPSKYFDDRWCLTPFGSYIFSDRMVSPLLGAGRINQSDFSLIRRSVP